MAKIYDGVKAVASTISPNNKYSIENFQRCGFKFEKNVKAYGGLDMALYVKRLGS